MTLQVGKINHDDEAVRRRIFEFLAPREAHNLFILGNLTAGMAGSHLYAASMNGQWLGVCAYYDQPKSLIPFATDPDVVRALVRHVATIHSPIEWINAIGYVARPALEAAGEIGFTLLTPADDVFMECPMPDDWRPPQFPGFGAARPFRPEDARDVALLLRRLSRHSDYEPISPEEVERIRTRPNRWVLDHEGTVVSVASTNGIGVRAFQILGVATAFGHDSRGFARRVCAELMHAMHTQGARHAVLFTMRDNLPAQRCYQSLGFEVTDDYAVAHVSRE